MTKNIYFQLNHRSVVSMVFKSTNVLKKNNSILKNKFHYLTKEYKNIMKI